LGACAVHPTIPDPAILKAPTKEIILTEGQLSAPHEVLGPVEATLGGLHNADLVGAVAAAKEHLRNAAYAKYGERLDAIIDVKTTVVTSGGPFGDYAGWFARTRALQAVGVAVSFPTAAIPLPPLPPPDSTEELGFAEAVDVATDTMVSQLQRLPALPGAVDKRGVVIDPMLDAASGQQTVATRLLEQQVADRLRTSAQFEVMPFQIPRLSEARYLLTGTMRRVEGKAAGARNVFQINLAVTDMATGTVVARASSRARDEGLDTNPTPYYRDSPIVVKDQVVDGYIATAETPAGQLADPVYFERVTTATLISEALVAYNGERYQDALTLYRNAAATPAGEQLRVVNGIYLATWQLGHVREAEEAFGNVVSLGLRSNNLSVKFLFKPGTTEFWSDPTVSRPYDIWLRQIARQAATAKVCMNVVGHASRTGSEQFNDRLSLQRATYIKGRLEGEAPELASRIRAIGMSFRENIAGTGTDDARDALDRRVEFKITGC
jgi:outer membrane protein OmpA-like peptidoglycan-associated protein